jgi:hypothetical protein
MKAGFNKAYWYNVVGRLWSKSKGLELFCNIVRLEWIFSKHDADEAVRILKERFAPSLDLKRQDVFFEYYVISPQLLNEAFSLALRKRFISSLDDVLFALRTMVWYSAQRLLAFWGPRFYCVFRLVTGHWEVVDLRDIIRRDPYGEPGRSC